MKTITTIALLLISMVGFAQEDTITVDSTPYTKYVIVSVDNYFDWNAEVSMAKGYDMEDKTARCYPLDVELFTLIDKNPSKDVLMAVVRVNPSNQAYVGDLELFDFNEIVFKDTVLMEYDIKVKNKDWIDKHWDKVGKKDKTMKTEKK